MSDVVEVGSDSDSLPTNKRLTYVNTFWVRPLIHLEKELIIEEETKGIKLRTEALALVRNITPSFVQEISESLKHETNLIIYITGLPGTGKTESAKGIVPILRAWINHYFGITPQVNYTFGFKETNEIANKLEEYSIVLQDEQDRLSGKDSTSVMHAILNLQEITFRRNKITYIISSADESSRLRNACHVILEGFAGNWATRENKLIAYSAKTGKPLGHVIIRLLDEKDPVNLEHKRRETEYKRKILSQAGFVSVGIDKQRLIRDVAVLVEKVFGRRVEQYSEFSPEEKELLRIYRKEILKTDLVLSEIPGSEHYQTRVLNEAWRVIQRWQLRLKVELEDKKKEEREKATEEKESLLQRELEEKIPELVRLAAEKYQGQKNVKSVQLQTFFRLHGVSKENLQICVGLTHDHLEELNVSTSREAIADSTVFDEVTEDGLRFVLDKKVEDLSFVDTILKTMQGQTTSRIKTKKLNHDHVKAWYMRYRYGATFDRLSEEFGIRSKSSFTNKYKDGGWLAVVETEILGHAVEDALVTEYFKDYRVIAGNSEPDLVSPEGGTMVEVKTRTRRIQPKVSMLNKKEVINLQSGGILQLVLVSFRPGKCLLEFYSVKSITQEDQKDGLVDLNPEPNEWVGEFFGDSD